MKKDLKKLVKALEEQGFECLVARSGHVKVFLDGRYVTTFAGSPSDKRSWLNSIADARRRGFRWPPR